MRRRKSPSSRSTELWIDQTEHLFCELFTEIEIASGVVVPRVAVAVVIGTGHQRGIAIFRYEIRLSFANAIAPVPDATILLVVS